MSQFVYTYYQLEVNTQKVNKYSFPVPKTLTQAALVLMKLNAEAETYGVVYFLREDSILRVEQS